MVKVDIYRNSKEKYDIFILDTQRYLSGVAFDAVIDYLRMNLSDTIMGFWGFYEEEDVQSCYNYTGIAIRLHHCLPERDLAKKELEIVLQEALEFLSL